MKIALTWLTDLLANQKSTSKSSLQVGDFLCLCCVKRHSSPTQPPNVKKFTDGKFLIVIKQLVKIYDETKPNWLTNIGIGIVCVCRDGIANQSLVGYYWGKLCTSPRYMLFYALTNFRWTQTEWLEKETGKTDDDAFYNLLLEIPACSSGGYYLLCETSTSTSASASSSITLKHFLFSFWV
jgi:hypothetical protein